MTQQPANGFSAIGAEELAARNTAIKRENKSVAAMRTLINTRAKQLRDDPPPPDLQRSRDAIRAAETRRAWSQWHRAQAARHRAALTDLIAHHEAEAARLE